MTPSTNKSGREQANVSTLASGIVGDTTSEPPVGSKEESLSKCEQREQLHPVPEMECSVAPTQGTAGIPPNSSSTAPNSYWALDKADGTDAAYSSLAYHMGQVSAGARPVGDDHRALRAFPTITAEISKTTQQEGDSAWSVNSGREMKVEVKHPNHSYMNPEAPSSELFLRSAVAPSPAPSPALSSNDAKDDMVSDESQLGAPSARSGVTPPMETASISTDVPATVDVPSQPRFGRSASLGSTDQQVMQASPTQSRTKISNSSSNSLRRGKWTVEEEAYVARVIQDFNSGYLNAPAGTTLRSYLSDKLQCDPMRITKKFTGDACIGKRVFHPAVRCPSNTAAVDKAQAELDALERRWRRRLEMQQRESAKKAAASAAAAAAVAHRQYDVVYPAPGMPSTSGHGPQDNPQQVKDTLVARTASWLERANAVLSTGDEPANPSTLNGSRDHAQAVKLLPPQEIEDQMKEVQRLIHEGPIIQQTTAGLPDLLHSNAHSYSNLSSLDHEGPPVDKRPRRLSGSDTSGAEDAEALVGFLNSVRAAAAASSTGSPD